MTCEACVGLGREKRLALGAATGTAAASISARATGCTGTRTATVGKTGGHLVGHLSRTGQRPASTVPARNAGPGSRRGRSARETERGDRLESMLTWTISGSVDGSLFRREQPPHRFAIERVDAKAVHRLGRKGDQPSASKAFRGSGNRHRVRVVRRDPDDIGHDAYIVVRAAESVHLARHVRSGRSRSKALEERLQGAGAAPAIGVAGRPAGAPAGRHSR